MSRVLKRGGIVRQHPTPPSAEAGRREAGWALRALSVVPFVLAGAVGAVASLAWLLVLVFGVGIERESAWRWAAGKPAAETLPQIGLLVGVGAAWLGATAACAWAVNVASRSWQPAWFWPAAEAACVLLGLGLLVARVNASQASVEYGFTDRDRYFAVGVLGLSAVVFRLRRRQTKKAPAERRADHD